MIRTNLTYYLFIGFICLGLSCSKEETNPILFNEAIIGKWELREAIDRINYRDEEWHSTTPPYVSLYFGRDSSFIRYRDCSIVIDEGTFKVLETDSIIQLFIPFLNTLKPEEFTNESFIESFRTDEGLVKHKYFRLE